MAVSIRDSSWRCRRARPRACMASVILLACHESHLRVSPPPPTLSERLQSHLRNFLNSSSLDLASRSKSHNASSLSLGQWQAIHALRRRYYEPCSSCLNFFVRRKRLPTQYFDHLTHQNGDSGYDQCIQY